MNVFQKENTYIFIKQSDCQRKMLVEKVRLDQKRGIVTSKIRNRTCKSIYIYALEDDILRIRIMKISSIAKPYIDN